MSLFGNIQTDRGRKIITFDTKFLNKTSKAFDG